LPWASNESDNPGLQNKKYNGKEFVEMHGYDTYDIVWRQYYPAIGRFQTPDPEIEEAYNESPYAMCDNNMVNRTDPDGRFWNNIGGAILGAAVEYGSQVVANIVDKGGQIDASVFTENIDIADIGIAAIEGAITSGGSAIKSVGTKAAITVASEVARNIVDVKITSKGIEKKTNSATNVVKNTAIGLMGNMAASKLTKNNFQTLSKTQAVNLARNETKAAGKGLATNEAKKIASNQAVKNVRTKTINKKVLPTANKVQETVTSGGSESAKRKTDSN
jgi:RHS repeat-associated protein